MAELLSDGNLKVHTDFLPQVETYYFIYFESSFPFPQGLGEPRGYIAHIPGPLNNRNATRCSTLHRSKVNILALESVARLASSSVTKLDTAVNTLAPAVCKNLASSNQQVRPFSIVSPEQGDLYIRVESTGSGCILWHG